MEEKELFLVFIRKIGTALDGVNVYDLLFAEDPTIVYGEGWGVIPAGICSPEEKLPHESTYQLVKRIQTVMNLGFAQDNTCFSMQDCTDKVVALAWEDILGYEEYPLRRLVFHYGESYEEVEKKLDEKDIVLTDI